MAESTLVGQEIDGYVIGPVLGAGGMGAVYQATFKGTSEVVAIKVLHSEYSENPEFQARFVREVRLMEASRHENIIPILGYGIYENKLYLVMKMIKGQSLATLMLRRKLTPLTAWEVTKPVTNALIFAHEHNVLHRDVKPENVFIERDGDTTRVYLGDFGLGKQLGTDKTLTDAGVAVGTPSYMAPEAAAGERLDHRADIYSLTTMAYQLLLGILPFESEHSHLVLMAHITTPPPPPTSINPDFPVPLEEVLLRGLAKERNERFQSVQEFVDAYESALGQLPEQALNTVYWK